MRRFVLLCVTAAFVACSGSGPASSSGPSASRSTLTVDRTTGVVADGNQDVVATVTVLDADGKPLKGAVVALSLTGEGNSSSESPATGQDGVSITHLRSMRMGTKTLSASVEAGGKQVTLEQTQTLEFVAGPLAGAVFAVQPTTVKAGEPMTPSVVLRGEDRSGNPVASSDVTASVRLVRSTGGVVVGGSARPFVDGGVVFDGLVINRPQAGYALRAELSNGAAAESALFDVLSGDPFSATSSLVANPVNVIADGTATTTLTFTVKDRGGNGLGGLAVSIAATGTGNTLGSSSGSTDGVGVFTTTLASTTAEAKTVTATAPGLSLSITVTFIP